MSYVAVAHCRVSKGDKEGIKCSLKSQKSEILKLAEKLNIKENQIDWFIEDVARSSFSERADWKPFDNKMDEVYKNKNIKYFLAFSQERFCRNSRRSKIYKEKLRTNEVEIRFVSGDVKNPNTMEGFVLDHTGEMVAQMYSMKVSADTMRGCLENASTRDPETGYAYKNGGQPPFWLESRYIVIGKDKQGRSIEKAIWVENSKMHTANINNKPVTKTLWEWAKYYFLELRLNQELSTKKARDILNELKIPAPRGKKWEHTCLYEAEKNVSLYGLGIYNKRKYSGGSKGRIKDISEWIQEENAHPALITKEQFEKLAVLRTSKCRKKKNSSTNVNNDKLFTNNPERFYCASCHGKIISSGAYYTCGSYNSSGKFGCGSSYFAVPAKWLEEKVIQEIKKSLDSKTLEKIYNDFVAELKKNTCPDKSKVKLLEKNITQTNKEMNALTKSLTMVAMTGNEIAIKTIANKLEELVQNKELQESELASYNKPTLVKLPSFKEFEKQSMIMKALLSPENTVQKRKIVWMFVESIILDPKEKTVTVKYYKNPFSILLENDTKMANTSPNKKGSPLRTSNEMVAGAGFEPTTFGL